MDAEDAVLAHDDFLSDEVPLSLVLFVDRERLAAYCGSALDCQFVLLTPARYPRRMALLPKKKPKRLTSYAEFAG